MCLQQLNWVSQPLIFRNECCSLLSLKLFCMHRWINVVYRFLSKVYFNANVTWCCMGHRRTTAGTLCHIGPFRWSWPLDGPSPHCRLQRNPTQRNRVVTDCLLRAGLEAPPRFLTARRPALMRAQLADRSGAFTPRCYRSISEVRQRENSFIRLDGTRGLSIVSPS